MQIVDDIPSLRLALDDLRYTGQANESQSHGSSGTRFHPRTVGMVPTMGYLHDGHLHLVKVCNSECDVTVVTIFVNPTQFNRPEDFATYPRNTEADCNLLRSNCKVDIVFIPRDPSIIYPQGHTTAVMCKDLNSKLEGAFRPGHFDGVTLVVSKLLNMAQPDKLYLGAKDAQQCVVLSRMIVDLNFRVQPRIIDTVRDPVDGLALSSRNVLLTTSERTIAPTIYKGLKAAKHYVAIWSHLIEFRKELQAMGPDASVIKKLIQHLYDQVFVDSASTHHCKAQTDYISIANAETLDEAHGVFDYQVIASVAVMMSKARLIDNVRIPPYYKSDDRERIELVSSRDKEFATMLLSTQGVSVGPQLYSYMVELYHSS
mmetsp:Transcript_3128/g.5390  ORF Transcript_3128/g.5390 Transcript_3128/m.5390 type:complete len:372 (+) Transcript_3128:184-1299(+)